METLIGLVIFAAVAFCYHLWNRPSVMLSRVSQYVAGTLYHAMLEPIKARPVQRENDKRVMTMDDNVARCLIEYVTTAKHLLDSFYSKSWDRQSPEEKAAWEKIFQLRKSHQTRTETGLEDVDKAKARRERIPEYAVWQQMEDVFFGKEVSLTGQDLYDPIAYWSRQLYQFVNVSSLKLDEILEVHSCKHGEVAFRTGDRTIGINTKTDKFSCNECSGSDPQYVLKTGCENVPD